MKTYNKEFRSLLQKEHLSDKRQFLKTDYFDEVPIYSRYSQLAFLKHLNLAEKDEVLLLLGVSYIDEIARFLNKESSVQYFIALTLKEDNEGDPLVPMLFFANGTGYDVIQSRIRLSPEDKSTFTKKIRHSLLEQKMEGFEILLDYATLPDTKKVFIGHKKPLSSKMMCIRKLLK